MSTSSGLRTALHRVPFQVRILVLGSLSWALCVALPFQFGAAESTPLNLLGLLLGPVLLGFGTWSSRRDRTSTPFILLSAFPVALCLGVSRIAQDQALSIYSPSTLLLSLLSLAAYGSTALEACQANMTRRKVEHKPLGELPQVAPFTRRRYAANLVLGTLTAGVLATLTYASSATPAHYREQWGQAAHAGAVVAALGAGLFGCVALATLAPALRAVRGETRTRPDPRRRLMWLFLVAASGVISYLLTR